MHITKATKKEKRFMNLWGKRIAFSNPIVTKVLFEIIDGQNFKDYTHFDIAYQEDKKIITKNGPIIYRHDKPIYTSIENLAMYNILNSIERGIITTREIKKIVYKDFSYLFSGYVKYIYSFRIEKRSLKNFDGYMETLLLKYSYYLYEAMRKYLWAEINDNRINIEKMNIFRYTHEDQLKKLDFPISYFLYNMNSSLKNKLTLCDKYYTIKDYEHKYAEESNWIYQNEKEIFILYQFINLDDLDIAIFTNNTDIIANSAFCTSLPESESFYKFASKFNFVYYIQNMNKYQHFIRLYMMYTLRRIVGDSNE